MTETEAKERAVIRSIRATMLSTQIGDMLARSCADELERALEREAARHAAELRELKERFSEAVERVLTVTDRRQETHAWRTLSPFILPAPDPLVEVLSMASSQVPRDTFAERLAEAGYEIRKIGADQ